MPTDPLDAPLEAINWTPEDQFKHVLRPLTERAAQGQLTKEQMVALDAELETC